MIHCAVRGCRLRFQSLVRGSRGPGSFWRSGWTRAEGCREDVLAVTGRPVQMTEPRTKTASGPNFGGREHDLRLHAPTRKHIQNNLWESQGAFATDSPLKTDVE